MKIYCFSIDTNTLKTDSHISDHDEMGFCGCIDKCNCNESARYNEDGFECVYSESLISLDKAKALVYNECLSLRDKFQKCLDKLDGARQSESL